MRRWKMAALLLGMGEFVKGNPLCGGIGSLCGSFGSGALGNASMQMPMDMSPFMSGGCGGSGLSATNTPSIGLGGMSDPTGICASGMPGIGGMGMGAATTGPMPMLDYMTQLINMQVGPGMNCNKMSLPDKMDMQLPGKMPGQAALPGLLDNTLPTDCINKLSGLLMNGWAQGQRSRDLCCSGGAAFGGVSATNFL